ncbi:MAG TPA: alpha/beta hydrolase [Solirubrobacterales bacterium]|nr:alpha/beta hydrolase [Solirubrobacterales bacterium]
MRVTLVAAPGAFVTDAEFWYRPVAELLEPHDIAVRTVDLPSCGDRPPLGGLFDDARAMQRAMDSVEGPVILAGHSYSGIVITQAAAGRSDKVKHLLYISGIVGDKCIMESDYVVPGEAPETQIDFRVAGRKVPLPDSLLAGAKTGGQGPMARFAFAFGRAAVRAPGVEAILGEGAGSAAFKSNELRRLSNPELIEEGLRRVTKQSVASFLQGPNRLAWQEIPSTYVLGLNDGEVPQPQLRAQASRCTEVIEAPTNHFCHLDRPDIVADAVVRIVDRIDAEAAAPIVG